MIPKTGLNLSMNKLRRLKHLASVALCILSISAMPSCQTFPDALAPSTNTMRRVCFEAGTDDYNVKSTLVPNDDETLFCSVWEAGDRLFLKYTYGGLSNSAQTETWNEYTGFEVELPDIETNWTYQAVHPVPNENGEFCFDIHQNKTQEILCSDTVKVAKAYPGFDDEENEIRLKMKRLTTAIYFHVTSKDLAGNRVSSVSIEANGEQPLWADRIVIYKDKNGIPFLKPAEGAESVNKVAVKFSTAVDMEDFSVLFNVLPFKFDKLEMTVNLDDGRSFCIKRNSSGVYEAGKLYTIKKEFSSGQAVIKSFAAKFEKFAANGILISGNGNTNEEYEDGGEIDADIETKSDFGDELLDEITVNFEEGDSVSVFDGINSSVFTAAFSGTTTELSGEIRQSLQHFLLYPANKDAFATMGRICTEIPSVQKAVPGGFDKQAQIATGNSGSGQIITLHNATAMLRFTASGHWTRMVIKTLSGEWIAGGVYVNAETNDADVVESFNNSNSITLINEADVTAGAEYFVCIRPLSFKKNSGFTVEFFDGDILLLSKKINSGEMTVKRSEILNIGDFVITNKWNPGEIILSETSSGNSLIFADRNCGASSPEDPGKTYTLAEANILLAEFGDGWRLPTAAELEYLTNNVVFIWQWVSSPTSSGFKVARVGFPENYAYLPVPGSSANYWTSDITQSELGEQITNAVYLTIKHDSGDVAKMIEGKELLLNGNQVIGNKYYIRAVREVEP